MFVILSSNSRHKLSCVSPFSGIFSNSTIEITKDSGVLTLRVQVSADFCQTFVKILFFYIVFRTFCRNEAAVGQILTKYSWRVRVAFLLKIRQNSTFKFSLAALGDSNVRSHIEFVS